MCPMFPPNRPVPPAQPSPTNGPDPYSITNPPTLGGDTGLEALSLQQQEPCHLPLPLTLCSPLNPAAVSQGQKGQVLLPSMALTDLTVQTQRPSRKSSPE